MYFTWGTAKDAARLDDRVRKLARHVGTSPWPQSSVALKAMSILVTPEFEEPTVSTREYWADPGRTVKTNERTRPGFGDAVVVNPPVKEDWGHNLEVEDYNVVKTLF